MFQGIVRARSFQLAAAIFFILLLLPPFVPRFFVYILALIYVTSLLAMSLNLLVGHGGMYQFHHAVFYGVGAYTAALMLTKTRMPVWVAFLAGPIAAAVVGLVIGWFCIRLTRLYFGMLQISLGSLVWAVVFRWYSFTGGDDGIHGVCARPAGQSGAAHRHLRYARGRAQGGCVGAAAEGTGNCRSRGADRQR